MPCLGTVTPWPPPVESRSPSGAQHEIRHGDQVAVVTEVGATLRSYEAGGPRLIDGFEPARWPTGAAARCSAPWPNRVRDGRWTWDGADLQLAINEAANNNAIHGLVRWVGWSVGEHGTDAVTLTTTVWPQPGLSLPARPHRDYRLDDAGLSVASPPATRATARRRTASASTPT